jgi:cytochrome P450
MTARRVDALAQLTDDPHPLLAELREREPVAWVDDLGGWLVTRRDLALRVMRDAGSFTVDDPRFSTGRVVGPSMLTRDGEAHDRHRAPFAPAFRKVAVRERFGAVVAAETERLLASLEPAGEAELRRAFAGPLAAASITHALGLDRVLTGDVLRWYDAIVDAVTRVTAGEDVSPAGEAAFAQLRRALGDDRVSDHAVLLFGGIETTEGMIANAVWHLLSHPEALARVRAEPGLLVNAIEESLRLEPAAATVDRYATATIELAGARIGAGDLVTVSIAGANRDPAVFPDPDHFDVARDNARLHIAFAHGPHVCLGMHLARLEAHTAVGGVLERLPRLRLAAPTAPRGLVFRKPPELRVAWG